MRSIPLRPLESIQTEPNPVLPSREASEKYQSDFQKRLRPIFRKLAIARMRAEERARYHFVNRYKATDTAELNYCHSR